MKRYLHLIIYMAVAGFLCGCRPASAPEQERVLTVSIEPLRYLTERIAGAEYRVNTLVPKGSSPETYEPAPDRMMQMERSRAYIYVGELGFERTWTDNFRETFPDMALIKASEPLELMRDAHGHAGADPHVWTSPANMKAMARHICASLCRLDTAYAEFFERNLQAVLTEIQAVDDSIRTLTAPLTQRTFLIYHPALTYFARDYGLTQLAIEADGKEPAPARLAELIGQCRSGGIRTILVQQEFDRSHASLVALETGTRIVAINPLSYDWPSEMIHIAQALCQP